MHQKNIWYAHAGLHKEVHDLDLMGYFFRLQVWQWKNLQFQALNRFEILCISQMHKAEKSLKNC